MSLSLTPSEITCADVNQSLRLTITCFTNDYEPIVIDAVGAHCYFNIEVPNFTKPLSIYDHYDQFQKELFEHTDELPIYHCERYGYKMYTYHKQEVPYRFIRCYFNNLKSMTHCREQLSKRMCLPNFGTFKLNIYGGELPYKDDILERLIGIKRRYSLRDDTTIDISCLYPEINTGKMTKRALK
jgi:hypothetical protein